MVSTTPGRCTPGKDPVSNVQEAGWASGTIWTGAENLAPTGIRSPDRLARSESLYRLSYRGPNNYTLPYKEIPYIIYKCHRSILLQIAPTLTARYVHSFYKAAQYMQFLQPHLSHSSYILHFLFIYVIL